MALYSLFPCCPLNDAWPHAFQEDHKTLEILWFEGTFDLGAWYKLRHMECTSLYRCHNISKLSDRYLHIRIEVVEATKMLDLIYTECSLIRLLFLLQLLFPSLGVSSMRILCPMKALTTSLKTRYRLKPLWFRKSTCMPYYTCRPSKKNKGLAGSPAMINADLCYAR